MKKILIIIVLICIGFYQVHTKLTKIDLPEGNLEWSTIRPVDAKMCVPAAFTDIDNSIIGSYKINGKSYQNNNKYKISLNQNTFHINKRWESSNGFQQLILVNNYKPTKFKDLRKCMRRALCKDEKNTFILESNYPMTLSSFASYCSLQCKDAIYLDMGEYGYGYIKQNNIVKPLYIFGFLSKNKQTNWLYIK